MEHNTNVRGHCRFIHVLIVTRVELTCGQTPEVSHATVKTTGSGYMDKATYTCTTGYQSDGQQHVLVCSTNANWEGDKITCTGKTPYCRYILIKVCMFVHLLNRLHDTQYMTTRRCIIHSFSFSRLDRLRKNVSLYVI